MIKNWSSFASILALITVCAGGCGFVEYPEEYAAPEFEVYRLTTDAYPDWWKCSYEAYGNICEATITRSENGEYVAEIAISNDRHHEYGYNNLSPELVSELEDQEPNLFDLAILPPRILTEQEVAQLQTLFGDLHINRLRSPFQIVCCLGLRLTRVHHWDDVVLSDHARRGAIIDYRDSGAIVTFLGELVQDEQSSP